MPKSAQDIHGACTALFSAETTLSKIISEKIKVNLPCDFSLQQLKFYCSEVFTCLTANPLKNPTLATSGGWEK